MANHRRLSEARERGSLAAIEELLRLELDLTRPIDVFSVIEQQGIWLVFVPMDNALGTYLDEGNGARGVFVNNRRPRSVQRLTAAHEYGHCCMGHFGSVDGTDNIEGSTEEEREAEAQAFAVDFLMPLDLVESQWDALRLPTRGDEIEAHEVYLLAVSMGTSYRACVVQLRNIEKISKQRAVELLLYKPRELKRLIGNGIGPLDPWADIWPIEESDAGRAIAIKLRDEVRLQLSESPSSGFRWVIDNIALASNLVLTSDEFEGTGKPGAIAAGGHRFLSFRAVNLGAATVRLELRRPWLSGEATKTFSASVEVESNATGGEEPGLRSHVQALVLANGGK